MNENDTTVEVEETQNTDTESTETQKDEVETKEETRNDKYTETPEARVSRLRRELKRAQQKLGVEEEVEVKPKTKSFSLDRADKAFLNANGIKGQDEYNLVTDFVKNTGKDIEEIIDSKYFQSELKDSRATRESKMASDAASGSNRTGNSAQDTVEYWINKGTLPPPYMKQLRRDVVNTRQKADSHRGTFSDTPVIGK